MKYHYTYRITNIKLNKHYYGVRTSNNLIPINDLGIKYFSSSRDKDFIKDQKENPQHYKYKIIRIFKLRKEALELEIKLHDKFDVGINESFYNRSKQTSTGWSTEGTNHFISQETKRKISNTLTGRKRPEHSIKKTGAGNPMFGKHGKNNPKSFKYILYNNFGEIVEVCFGAELKELFKKYKLPSTMRYMKNHMNGKVVQNAYIKIKKVGFWRL